MNNKHLQFGRKFGKLSVAMLMLLFSLLWAVSAKSQTNIVSWDFTSSGSTGKDYSTNVTPTFNRNSAQTTGLTGATLTDLVLSTTFAGETSPYKAGGAVNYLGYQPYSALNSTIQSVNTTDYVQFAVTLPAGSTFNSSNTLSLFTLCGATGTTGKSFGIYYTYRTDGTVPATTTANELTTKATGSAGSGINGTAPNGGTSTITTLQEVDNTPVWAQTTNGAAITVANTNTCTIPASGNSTSNVLVIQIRMWSSTTGGNFRFSKILLTSAASLANTITSTVTPTIGSLSTSSVYAGATTPTTLTIIGTGFNNTTPTTVNFNGNSKTVTYTSSTQISIPLTTSDLQTAGIYPIVVSNGTGLTATTNFTVNTDPAVTVTNVTQPSAANITQGSTKNSLQAFILNNTSSATATLNTVTAHFTGTYTASDIANLRLYYSTTNSLSGATAFTSAASASVNASSATTGSENVTFTLGTTLSAGNNYFWVTVSPASGANITAPYSTINATALSSGDFSFVTTTVTFNSISAGGVQTIAQGQTVYMDDIANQPSGTIAQNAKKAVLAGFYLNPYASSVFSAINVYATGSATSTDLSNLAIYKDVNNDGLYTPGTDVLVSTNTPTFSTSAVMAFTLNQTVSSKTQYLIVADVADVFVSTVNRTVQLTMNDIDFTVSNYPPSGSFNATSSLSIAAPTGTSTITSGTSSATISSVANSSGTAVAAYSFTYHNDNTNTSADSRISSIVISQGSANNISSWSGVIAGATLTDGTNTINGAVGASTITFSSIPTTDGTLGNVSTNTTKTYTLNIWLQASITPATLKQTLSGSKLAFALTNSSITVTGSTLAASQSINSGTTNGVISVIGTKLAYIAAPGSENINTILNPSVTVQVEDANGNYDLTYATSVTISSSPTGISGTLNATPSSGLVTFSNLQFSTPASYTVTATSGSLTSAIQTGILISNGLYFGSSSGTSWEGANKWGISAAASPTVNWTDGYSAVFNGTGTAITVGSAHSLPSLVLNSTGYSINGIGVLTLTGSTPEIDINGAGILACPITTSSNLSINQLGTANTLTVGSTTATSSATNYYSTNFAGTTTVGTAGTTGFSTIALKANNPFGSSASNTLIWNAASGSNVAFTGAESYTVPASIFPISIASNIILPTGTVVTVGPSGASVYGNLIKYMGSISGNINAMNISNSVGYGTSGKGNVYFGGKNTYTGSTLMYGNNASAVLGGGDNTLPTGTDIVFWTGASGYPVMDLRGTNETVSSINTIDGTTTQTATVLHGEGFFNGSLMLPSYAVTSSSVTVKTSDVTGFTANGTLIFGAGIPYGTTITGTSATTASNGDACTVLTLTPPSGKSITSVSLATGFPVFFEDPNNQVYKTLSIEGAGTTGGNFGTSNTIDRTGSTFNATINGKINLALTSNNNASNVLTLGNANTYTGTTTVTSGKLVLGYISGNTLPATNSATVNGGTLEIKTNQTLAGLTITSGTLLIDNGATLTITGTFANTGGTVTNNGTFTYSNATALTTGGTAINNNGTFNVTAANLVINAGTFTNAASSTVSVINNTINATGGIFSNNGILASTSNVTSTGGVFNLNTNQTLNNLTLSSGGTVIIANNTTTTINGILTYGGGVANTGTLANSGTIAYGATGGLTYAAVGTNFQFNNANEFLPTNLPATLTIPVGDTIQLDNNNYTFSGNLVLNGTIASVGTFLNAYKLALTGTSKTVTGTGTIGAIQIDGTISVPSGSNLNILNKLILSSGTLTTNNNVTLKSTSIDSSAVVDVVASGKVSGNIIVERYIPKGYRAYRDIASGIYNATTYASNPTVNGSIFTNWQDNGSTSSKYGMFITGANAADNTSAQFSGTASSFNPTPNTSNGLDYSINGNASAFTYSNGTFNTGISNTQSTLLDPFKGYRVLVRGARDFNLYKTPLLINLGSLPMIDATTLRATGQLVTGTVTYSISGVTGYSNGTTTQISSAAGLNSSSTGFSLVANPYVCPVQWSLVYAASGGTATSGMNASYWYLDPTSSSAGKYIAYNALTGSAVVYSSASSANYSNSNGTSVVGTDYIQAGQAFFLQNHNSNTPNLVFTEGTKATASSKKRVFGITAPLSKIYVSLMKQVNNTFSSVDGAAFAFSNEFGNAVYGPQDALKFGNANDNISISDKGHNLSIDGRLPATAADVLPFTFAKLNGKNYQIQIDATSYNGLTPALKDNFTGSITALTLGVNTIDVTVDTAIAATYAKRFSIVFNTTLAINSIVASASLNNAVATISWNTVEEKGVSRFEVEKSTDAKSFSKIVQLTAKNTATASYSTTDNSITVTSYYRIKAISEVGTVCYSNVVKLTANHSPLTSYSLYPNPLKGKVLNIGLSNVAAGQYTVTVTNILGQKIQETAISHLGGNASHAITVSNTLAAATYTVTISQVGSNHVISQTKLIVN